MISKFVITLMTLVAVSEMSSASITIEDPLPIIDYQLTQYDKKQIKCLADNALMEAESEEYFGKLSQIASTINNSKIWDKDMCDMVWTPNIYEWTTISKKKWKKKYKHQKQFKNMTKTQASWKRAAINLMRSKRRSPEEYQKSEWIAKDLYLKYKLQGVVKNDYITTHANYITAQLILDGYNSKWFRDHAIDPVHIADPNDPHCGHVFFKLSEEADPENGNRVRKYLTDKGVKKVNRCNI